MVPSEKESVEKSAEGSNSSQEISSSSSSGPRIEQPIDQQINNSASVIQTAPICTRMSVTKKTEDEFKAMVKRIPSSEPIRIRYPPEQFLSVETATEWFRSMEADLQSYKLWAFVVHDFVDAVLALDDYIDYHRDRDEQYPLQRQARVGSSGRT